MTVYDWLTVAAAVLSILWLVWMVARGNNERSREDDARAYFDEYGHWPDERPGAQR